MLPCQPKYKAGVAVWLSDNPIVSGRNISLYSADRFYPEHPVVLVNCGMMRDYKIATVLVYPFTYNPVSGEVKKTVSATLQLTYAETKSRTVTPALMPQSFTDIVQSLAVNYDGIAPYYSSRLIAGSQNRTVYRCPIACYYIINGYGVNDGQAPGLSISHL